LRITSLFTSLSKIFTSLLPGVMTKTSLSYPQFCRHFLILLASFSGCLLILNCLSMCDIQRCYQSVTMDLEVLDNFTGFSHFFHQRQCGQEGSTWELGPHSIVHWWNYWCRVCHSHRLFIIKVIFFHYLFVRFFRDIILFLPFF